MPLSSKRSAKRQQQYKSYLDFYRFERDPFVDEDVVGLFFSGAERRKTVDALLHFSRYGSAPLLLTGGQGFGKSSVLLEFSRNIAADVALVITAAELMLSQAQLLVSIMDGLHISYERSNNEQYFLTLRNWVSEQAERKRQVVICIDDAHNLSPEFTLPLLELLTEYPDTLKIIFAGEAEAKTLLIYIAEQQNILLNTLELAVFTQQQVADYVAYRLSAVGFTGEFPLSEMQLQAATLRSHGSVKYLNDQIREMLMAAIDGDSREHTKFPFLHSAILLALMLLIVFIWQRSDYAAPPLEPEPILLEAGTSGLTDANASVMLGKLGNTLAANRGEELLEVPPQAAVITSALSEMPASIVIATQSLTEEVSSEDQAIVESQLNEVQLEPRSSEIDGSTDIAVSKDDEPRALVEHAEQTSSTEAVNPVHQRLLAWPQLGYALQVFGTHNPQRARWLIKKYFGEVDLLFYETRHNGKPWYVVINGPYSGRESAQKAIDELPESLQRMRPWPRNVASIKSDIQRFALLIQNTAMQNSSEL